MNYFPIKLIFMQKKKKALEMLISLGSFKSYCGEFFGTGKAIKLQLKGEKKRKKMLKMLH